MQEKENGKAGEEAFNTHSTHIQLPVVSGTGGVSSTWLVHGLCILFCTKRKDSACWSLLLHLEPRSPAFMVVSMLPLESAIKEQDAGRPPLHTTTAFLTMMNTIRLFFET